MWGPIDRTTLLLQHSTPTSSCVGEGIRGGQVVAFIGPHLLGDKFDSLKFVCLHLIIRIYLSKASPTPLTLLSPPHPFPRLQFNTLPINVQLTERAPKRVFPHTVPFWSKLGFNFERGSLKHRIALFLLCVDQYASLSLSLSSDYEVIRLVT